MLKYDNLIIIVFTNGNNLTVNFIQMDLLRNYLLLVYDIGVKDSIAPAYYQQ